MSTNYFYQIESSPLAAGWSWRYSQSTCAPQIWPATRDELSPIKKSSIDGNLNRLSVAFPDTMDCKLVMLFLAAVEIE